LRRAKRSVIDRAGELPKVQLMQHHLGLYACKESNGPPPQIKNLLEKLEKSSSDPLHVEWDAVQEVGGENLVLKDEDEGTEMGNPLVLQKKQFLEKLEVRPAS
jgi:hypothetical protein